LPGPVRRRSCSVDTHSQGPSPPGLCVLGRRLGCSVTAGLAPGVADELIRTLEELLRSESEASGS